MKEYINKTTGEYRKTSEVVSGEQWMGIPDEAIKATLCNEFLIFWKDDYYSLSYKNGDTDFNFDENNDYGFNEYMSINDDAVIVWQRPTQPEALPFVDDEPSLNKQYAEIEKVRQNAHYFINVSDVDEVDFYEIAKRYNVADPAIQHILKKCLAIGNRGHKDLETDLRDILKTAKRALEINGFSL